MARKPTLSILVSAIMMISCGATLLYPHKVHVDMRNDLPGGLNLSVHCKSKNDDLGVKEVGPGQVWGFKFRTNIWGTTQFTCEMEWPGTTHFFDIFIDARDFCNVCFWGIRMEHPCLFYKEITICYDWKDY